MADHGIMPLGTHKPLFIRPRGLVGRWAASQSTKGLKLRQSFNASAQGDATKAEELYAGRFALKDETIFSTPNTVFLGEQGSDIWQAHMMGLSWLKDFAASNRKLHDQYALRLLHYWYLGSAARSDIMQQSKAMTALAIDGAAIAKRLLSQQQNEFFGLVKAHWQNLTMAKPANSEQAVDKALAQFFAHAAFDNLPGKLSEPYSLFESHIDRVILADGGHSSGETTKLVNTLNMALPLLQVEKPILPKALLEALYRGLRFLKMLARPDGTMSEISELAAHTTPPDLQAVTNFPDQALQSGFVRLEQKAALLLIKAKSVFKMEFSDSSQVILLANIAEPPQDYPLVVSSCIQGKGLTVSTNSLMRTTYLASDGQDLRVQDDFASAQAAQTTLLVPAHIRLSRLQDSSTLMLVLPDMTVWHLRQKGGNFEIASQSQHHIIAIRATGKRLNWSLKKQVKTQRLNRRKPAVATELLI
ncbi:MAG: hypothetical protein KGO94_02245 [Alphaproteobacteria bacterium]|nr:hypothetical protein [Alphaproteobacteria bacterium]